MGLSKCTVAFLRAHRAARLQAFGTEHIGTHAASHQLATCIEAVLARSFITQWDMHVAFHHVAPGKDILHVSVHFCLIFTDPGQARTERYRPCRQQSGDDPECLQIQNELPLKPPHV